VVAAVPVAVVIAVVVVGAGPPAASDPMAVQASRSSYRHRLVQNRRKVVPNRGHGGRPVHDHGHNLHPFGGSHPGRRVYFASEFHRDALCGRFPQDYPPLNWTWVALIQ
jgi:hypothetical protein